MKKLVIAAIALFTTASAFSQTEQGDFLVGGSIGFRTNKNNSSFTVLPNAGYFFADNFAAGANVTVSVVKNGTIKTSDFGLGPFLRYYLGKTTVRPFLTTSVGYINQSIKINDLKTTTRGFNFLAGLGYAAFISDIVALEGIGAYNYTQFKNASSYNGFSLNFGFQIYLSNSRMGELKRGKIE